MSVLSDFRRLTRPSAHLPGRLPRLDDDSLDYFILILSASAIAADSIRALAVMERFS